MPNRKLEYRKNDDESTTISDIDDAPINRRNIKNTKRTTHIAPSVSSISDLSTSSSEDDDDDQWEKMLEAHQRNRMKNLSLLKNDDDSDHRDRRWKISDILCDILKFSKYSFS